MLFPLRSTFEPILLPGQTAQIFKADDVINVKIVAVGALPSYRHDFGALTADSTGNDVTQLKMRTKEMAQMRMRILEPFEVEFTHPSETVRQWNTDAKNFRLRPWSEYEDSQALSSWMFAASEFFVFEDETPRFDLYPFSTTMVPAPQGHIEFFGIKYRFEIIDNDGLAKIWVNSWPAAK